MHSVMYIWQKLHSFMNLWRLSLFFFMSDHIHFLRALFVYIFTCPNICNLPQNKKDAISNACILSISFQLGSHFKRKNESGKSLQAAYCPHMVLSPPYAT